MQNWLSLQAPALSRSGFDLEMTTYQATYGVTVHDTRITRTPNRSARFRVGTASRGLDLWQSPKVPEEPYLEGQRCGFWGRRAGSRYRTWGLSPGVRRVRTSSSATRMTLMLLSWETRRIRLKAWSVSIL